MTHVIKKVEDTFSLLPMKKKLCLLIALGYGETQGVPHKSKVIQDVAKADGEIPEPVFIQRWTLAL